MASVTSTITEEFLTCSICFETFKDPKTLPCLHSFCKDCINNLIQGKDGRNSYPCPICRELFELPQDGADYLKTNFCLKNLIDFVTSTKEVNKPCSFCRLKGENNYATSLCLTCHDLLCPECANHRHRSSTLTLHHRIAPLVDVASGKYDDEIRSKQQIPCRKHEGEDVRFFCETCDVPVCRDCIVLGHQNHKCVAPADARKHVEKNLSSLMASLKEQVKTFHTAKDNITSAMRKIEAKREELIKSLEKQTNTIIEKLMHSKRTVEIQLNQNVNSEKSLLQQQKESIEEEGKILNETYVFCSKILTCGSDIEVLSMKTEMQERLLKLRSSIDSEICDSDIASIVLPVIEFCNKETIFKMEVKMCDIEKSKSKLLSNAVLAKEHTNDENNEKSRKVFEDQPEIRKPYYTSVAWLDENTIAVADKRNQKLKLISREGVTKMSFVKNCIVVCSYKYGLACKTEESALHVYNTSLELQKTFTSVLTLLTCHPKSLDLCWMSNSKTITILRNNDVKEITIYDPNTESNPSEPKFGHVLLNGTFAFRIGVKDVYFL